ncbi:acyltransferase family protein [Novosphingobium sp.]|uniref:acyltransferase family protein n=1 Tax=Novosphingobium sp. TaxID=1874826 RepID=UPI00333EBA2F
MTSATIPHVRYRSDIDGLRALAILPVVFNHMGLRGVWGGFVGVDIFFVISGFLITGNIVAEARAGRYSIAEFYRRRILRIFPALFTLFAVCTVIAAMVMLPSELVRYARSLTAATFFGSNVLFYAETGYFEPAARLKPLLHTWSLAIEEQFYILWPLIIAPLARTRASWVPLVTGAVIAASLAASIWLVGADPSAAYYLLPSRAFELGLGALVATAPPMRLSHRANDLLAWAGLAAIIVAIHSLHAASPFPGALALLPCGGAALLILTGGQGGLVARLLGTAPCVAIGRISYSLYLWHWPVIVFASIGLFLPVTLPVQLGELAVMFGLAIASTRWVERPFRVNAGGWSTRAVLTGAVLAMLGCAAIGATLIAARGFPARFTPAQQAVAAFDGMDGDALYRRGSCFAVGPRMEFAAQSCLAHDRPLPNLLLLGDSHAAQFWPGLSQYGNRFNVLQATHTGCKPLLYAPSADPCRELFRAMLGQWITTNRSDVMLLIARWRLDDLPLLQHTLADPAVRAAHPVLVGPVPQYSSALPRLLVFGSLRHQPDLAFRARDREVEVTDRAMRALAQRSGVAYISMVDLLCDAQSCLTWAAPGVPMQFDYGHFTQAGSVRAADLMMPAIERALEKQRAAAQVAPRDVR